jgi:D-amino-acid dehydrogenase
MQVVIIGGGIIGLSSAYYLSESGWDVTVLEKGDLRDNCSFGNMGYLSPSHLVPLAQPGIISQGLLWMFDIKSPFYVRPALSRALIDWGLKFFRASTKAHVERSAPHLANLLLLSKQLTADWVKSGTMQFPYVEDGCIMYYQSAKKEKEELQTAKMATDLGLQATVIDRAEAHRLEPELLPNVAGGVWYKDDAHLHPNSLMRELPVLLERRGVRILRQSQVTAVEKKQNNISQVRYTDAQGRSHDLSPDMVVLAAGSWSPPLARMMGEYLPLMPGKGYSTTISVKKQRLHIPCISLEHKVALTPWATQLRIGSTMEIGALNEKILFPRVQGILEAVPKFMPGYLEDADFRDLADLEKLRKRQYEQIWFGFRPVSADGMPYIGPAKKTKNLLIATGHAMLGLSMGAATGKIISELANGQPTSIDIGAFDPGRY